MLLSRLFAPLLIAGILIYSVVASAKDFLGGWTYKIKKIKIDAIKTAELMLQGVALNINLELNNPTAFKIKIKKLELKTYFDKKILSSSFSLQPIQINPKSNIPIILPTTILFKNIINNRKDIINELLTGKLTIQVVAKIESNYGVVNYSEPKIIEL